MKFPVWRISVRSALSAVAIVAILLGFIRWNEEKRRVSRYRELEQDCVRTEQSHRQFAIKARARGDIPCALSYEKAADEVARLKADSAKAALNPWETLPDPAR